MSAEVIEFKVDKRIECLERAILSLNMQVQVLINEVEWLRNSREVTDDEG